jgi:hypothetical protein
VGPGDWNDAGNWSNLVPTGTARFGTLSGTTVTFATSPTAPVDTLQFSNGAPTFHFNLGAQTLTIVGRGIIASPSSNAPAFTVVSPVKTTGLFFQGDSTAGNASFTLMGGSVQFSNTSSAADSTIVNNGGLILFANTSKAASSLITNNSGGIAPLFDSRTANNVAINKDGVPNDGVPNDGVTQFNGASSAGSSTIINNSGSTTFTATSTAATSTITNNKNGSTFFFGASTGDRARFINHSGGIFDISNLTSGGMTAGSIEGAGGYFLGSKTLTVGLNNLSTEVSRLCRNPWPIDNVFGPSEGHDSAVVSVQWTPSLITCVNYDGQLGRDNYDSNAVTGGISVRF